MKHPDQKYIEALLNNDLVLLEELYRKFSRKVKWMVLQNHGTEDDAADIFQEALLSIYQKARTQDLVLTCPLDAFLYLICKNKWLNELSKRKFKNVSLIEDNGVSFSEDSFKIAEECALKEQRFNLISEKLADLGAACQQLLRLSWSGKSMEEVAQALQVTYGYARKKKCECMAKLVLLVKQAPQFSSLK
jgi:RNA polymerase sigma factor (sigma-70 family)